MLAIAPEIAAAAAKKAAAPQKPAEQPAARPDSKNPRHHPMVFYIASGEPNACGPGCREWIAAEGTIESGTADRLRAFLKRFRGQLPPIYFSSPGGRIGESLAIGRVLRQRGMTVAIAATLPHDCKPDDDKACRALKQQGKPLAASLRSARCSSACAYALVGGKVRLIPPDAQLGVHAARWTSNNGKPIPADRLRQLAAKHVADIRTYLAEMGVSAKLHDIAARTPHEKVRYLSRCELAEFGIDRRSFAEGHWSKSTIPSLRIGKLFVLMSRGGEKSFRTNYVRLTCAGPYRARFIYFRESMPGEFEAEARPKILLGTLGFELSRTPAPVTVSLFEKDHTFAAYSSYVSFNALEDAEGDGGIVIEEPGDSGAPTQIRISTDRLPDLLREMRGQCRSTFTHRHTVPAL